jgi:hypothetical protein
MRRFLRGLWDFFREDTSDYEVIYGWLPYDAICVKKTRPAEKVKR